MTASHYRFPDAVLASHIGCLGKTGSGKTSTAKLVVEQVVAAGARVCILDPIKSDWWGVTASADGKRPGLPFNILGGPRQHVPLHGGAGAAIGRIVGLGELKLSILDMADFGPGEHLRFFVDFAPALFRHVTGILYLVVEEAHLFAPKDRGGQEGPENMAVHWMSRIASGSRSKGIRLLVCTQRTQKLHNDVLGSCESMIVHRLTLPADQKPAIDWLKGNTDKDTAAKISAELSSLKTGVGWLASGEAQIVERIHFPRIKTFDNSATPVGDGTALAVATAEVDQAALRSIIGEAVKEAEANDPKKLKARIAELEEDLRNQPAATLEQTDDGSDAVLHLEQQVNDLRQERDDARRDRADLRQYRDDALRERDETRRILAKADDFWHELTAELEEKASRSLAMAFAHSSHEIHPREAPSQNGTVESSAPPTLSSANGGTPGMRPVAVSGRDEDRGPRRVAAEGARQSGRAPDTAGLPAGELAVLTAIAQHRGGCTREQLTVLTAYKKSSRDTYIYKLKARGLVDDGERLTATPAGVEALGESFRRLPTGDALRRHWLERLPEGERRVLEVVLRAWPGAVERDAITDATEYKKSSRDTYIYKLAARQLIKAHGPGRVRATDMLFDRRPA